MISFMLRKMFKRKRICIHCHQKYDPGCEGGQECARAWFKQMQRDFAVGELDSITLQLIIRSATRARQREAAVATLRRQ